MESTVSKRCRYDGASALRTSERLPKVAVDAMVTKDMGAQCADTSLVWWNAYELIGGLHNWHVKSILHWASREIDGTSSGVTFPVECSLPTAAWLRRLYINSVHIYGHRRLPFFDVDRCAAVAGSRNIASNRSSIRMYWRQKFQRTTAVWDNTRLRRRWAEEIGDAGLVHTGASKIHNEGEVEENGKRGTDKRNNANGSAPSTRILRSGSMRIGILERQI
ncbi:hypothetical protein B0H11DRAFT_1902815 [Mycena galericulata]|nr:hypothetical protein B0H11DRAFT_1902815 [Mycena galericulata]